MGKNNRILIIDDDPAFARATQAILESQGYQVGRAQDSSEGLALMQREKPDLVLLDVMMSWPLEGVSLSRDMMESSKLRDIPIIMCSCIRNTESSAVFPLDEYLHIDAWLDKPCAPAQLLSEVESTLARHAKHHKAA